MLRGALASAEAAARATNAEPWEPPPGMVKRQCPDCRYFFAAPASSQELRCQDCVDKLPPAGRDQRLTERLSRQPRANRDRGRASSQNSPPTIRTGRRRTLSRSLRRRAQRPRLASFGAYPTLWVQLSLQALPDHKRSFGRT